jgi:membrane protease YdiL (CAAX protease family)
LILGYTYYKSNNNLTVPLILHFFSNIFTMSFQ